MRAAMNVKRIGAVIAGVWAIALLTTILMESGRGSSAVLFMAIAATTGIAGGITVTRGNTVNGAMLCFIGALAWFIVSFIYWVRVYGLMAEAYGDVVSVLSHLLAITKYALAAKPIATAATIYREIMMPFLAVAILVASIRLRRP